ncbi:MAG TPA: lysophospholipid acyltransferase family protein [Prolixibacteraceae bacterium]
MSKLAADIGIFLLKVFGLAPFWLMYALADLFYFMGYYIIGYRKKTVLTNLRNAFPEKTEKEIHKISKAFYHHLADLFFETIKAFQASEQTLKKRYHYKNLEVMDELYHQGKSVALLSGHYANWEWTIAMPKYLLHQVNGIYRPMQNKQFDAYMKKVRSRFGGTLIPASTSLRTMIQFEQSGVVSSTYYLTDQTALYDTKYWMMFLNQETPIFPGPEKIASRFKQAVVFMDIQKVRRGYYEVEFTKLFDDASQTKEFEVTKAHTQFLEDIIRKRPELWLWSHKRWKHKRPQHIPLQ